MYRFSGENFLDSPILNTTKTTLFGDFQVKNAFAILCVAQKPNIYAIPQNSNLLQVLLFEKPTVNIKQFTNIRIMMTTPLLEKTVMEYFLFYTSAGD